MSTEDPEKGIELQVTDELEVKVSFKGSTSNDYCQLSNKVDSSDVESDEEDYVQDDSDEEGSTFSSDLEQDEPYYVLEPSEDWKPFPRFMLNYKKKLENEHLKWWTPLHRTIHQCGEDLDVLDAVTSDKKQLKEWLQVREPDMWMTPVFLAVSKGRLDILEHLFEQDLNFSRLEEAELKSPNFDSKTALHEACMAGRINIVKFLCETCKHRWDPTVTNALHCNAAFFAATYGHLEILKYLLSLFSDDKGKKQLLSQRHKDGYTILHGAVYYKRLQNIENEGEDPEQENMDQQRLELLTYLVEEIKRLDAFDIMDKDQEQSDKITALHLAAKLGHVKLVKYLMAFLVKDYERDSWDGLCRNKYNAIMLHDAAVYSRVDVVKYLCEESFLNTKDYLMDSKNVWEDIPFSGAASGNTVEVMEMILEYGAKVGIDTKLMIMHRNRYGWSSLHHTAIRGHVEATKFLCDHPNGSDIVLLKDKWGNLALHLASVWGHNAVIEILVEQTPSSINDQNGKKGNGNTPLHMAASRGKSETVRLLLKKPHVILFIQAGKDKSTVLHEAIKSGSLACLQVFWIFKDKVKLPLDRSTESNGFTPLHLAIALQETEMALKCLEMEDAMQPSAINVPDKNKSTPLAQAAMTRNLRVVNAIMKKHPQLRLRLYNQQRFNNVRWRYEPQFVDYNPLDTYGRFPWTVSVTDGSPREEFLTFNKSPIKYHHPKKDVLENETSPINCLIREYPEAVIEVLNKCWTHVAYDHRLQKRIKTGKFDHSKCSSVILNFDMLEKFGRTGGFQRMLRKRSKKRDHAVGPLYDPRAYIEDNSPLQTMIRERSKKHVAIKTHPVVQALVDIKWNNFGWKYFAFFAFINLLFLSLLAGFTIKVQRDVFRNSTWECKNASSYFDYCFMTISKKSADAAAVGYALLCLTIILLISEIVDLADDICDDNRGFAAYIKSSLNITESIAYILTLVFVAGTLYIEDEMSSALWQTGAAANIFAFMNILQTLRATSFSHLELGLHIIMFRRIVVTFVKSIGFLFVMFTLGFVCVFYILSVGVSGNSYFAGFGSWSPYYKTFTMGVSGASFEDYDTGNDQAILQLNGYVLVLILFGIVIHILFMNLATGLAIADVNEIRENSKAEMNDIKIWNIYKAEQLFLIPGRFMKDELYFFRFCTGDLRQYANIPLADFKGRWLTGQQES